MAGIRTSEQTPFNIEMRFTMNKLLYNKPLEYTQLVFGGEIDHYLSLGCDHGRLED